MKQNEISGEKLVIHNGELTRATKREREEAKKCHVKTTARESATRAAGIHYVFVLLLSLLSCLLAFLFALVSG